MKAIIEGPSLFHRQLEKFFLVMDREVREKQMLKDPLCRNQSLWQEVICRKSLALNELSTLREIFRLSSSNENCEKQV